MRRRLAAGDIAQVDFLQSRVEAQQFQADVIGPPGRAARGRGAMAELLGPEVERAFDVSAISNPHRRAECATVVARDRQRLRRSCRGHRVQGAEWQNQIRGAKRVWTSRSARAGSTSFAASMDEGVQPRLAVRSVSVPLPFSRIYKGELEAARHTPSANAKPIASRPRSRQQSCAKPSPIPSSVGRVPCMIEGPVRFVVVLERSSTATSTGTPRWWSPDCPEDRIDVTSHTWTHWLIEPTPSLPWGRPLA